jgi:hypothetical protein
MEHVVAGQLNKQIAGDLGTGEQTIKVHRGRVMEKMGVDSLADLVRAAEHLGFGKYNMPQGFGGSTHSATPSLRLRPQY